MTQRTNITDDRRTAQTMKFVWLSWVLSAIVLLLLYIMAMMMENPVRLLIKGKKTTGIVVDIQKRNDSLVTPVVQFVTLNGEKVRVTGHSASSTSSKEIGEKISLLYDPAEPHITQFLSWAELSGILAMLGFIAFVLGIWISGILLAPELGLDDPLHILSTVIAHLKLSPTRFPLYFMLPLAIFACGLGAYIHYSTLHELKTNGIKVIGIVTGSFYESSKLSDGSTAGGTFNTITFTDLSGKEYTIKESRVKSISPLNEGDSVEVIYSQVKPQGGMINRWDELYIPFGFFAFCFLAFVTFSILLLKGKIKI